MFILISSFLEGKCISLFCAQCNHTALKQQLRDHIFIFFFPRHSLYILRYGYYKDCFYLTQGSLFSIYVVSALLGKFTAEADGEGVMQLHRLWTLCIAKWFYVMFQHTWVCMVLYPGKQERWGHVAAIRYVVAAQSKQGSCAVAFVMGSRSVCKRVYSSYSLTLVAFVRGSRTGSGAAWEAWNSPLEGETQPGNEASSEFDWYTSWGNTSQKWEIAFETSSYIFISLWIYNEFLPAQTEPVILEVGLRPRNKAATVLRHMVTSGINLASYPSLLTPAFVACSINTEEGLVKLIICNDVPGRWVDMWGSGTFLLYSCKVAFESKKRHQDCLMLSAQAVGHSTIYVCNQ